MTSYKKKGTGSLLGAVDQPKQAIHFAALKAAGYLGAATAATVLRGGSGGVGG